MSSNLPVIIVIGGGPAGLSACANLVSKGIRVILIERHRELGGRAASYLHQASGEILDLGPHTIIESNRNVIQHLIQVGTRHQIEFSPSLTIPFVHLVKGITVFRCPRLPSPWGFIWGLMTYRFLSLADRFHTIRLGYLLASKREDSLPDISIEEWFRETKVSKTAKLSFWEPTIAATLNDRPSHASLRSLSRIFRLGFLAPGQRSGLGKPQIGWGQLMTGNLRDQIVSGGGEVLTGLRVHQIWIEQGRASGVVLENGRRIQADAIIAAVPPWALRSLLPYRPSWLDSALRFRWSPIISMHWIGVNPLPFQTPVALLDNSVQWIFSRPVSSDKKRVILSTITGGDRQMALKPSHEIVSLITSAIKQSFPGWNPGSDNKTVLHKIHHATISIGPGKDDLRPGSSTDLPGFWIAGDWTKTTLPPTLESAVVSGKYAAENILIAHKLH